MNRKDFWFLVGLGAILTMVLIILFFTAPGESQRISSYIDAPITLHRDDVYLYDKYPADTDEAFDSYEYQQVRVYLDIDDVDTSCSLIALVWNSSAEEWVMDHPNIKTTCKDQYSFLWESRHAKYMFIYVHNISGTGKIDVYLQGSNTFDRRF